MILRFLQGAQVNPSLAPQLTQLARSRSQRRGRAPMSPPSGRACVAAGTWQRGWHRAVKPAAPPRAPPSWPAVPPPPRRARLRQSSRLCNVSSRSGGDDESGCGPGPAVAASAARPGRRTARLCATSLPPGRRGRLCAPRCGSQTWGQSVCGRAQRTADTGRPGTEPRDRPGTAAAPRLHAYPPSPAGADPSYDSGDTATSERRCCPLRCATATGS